MSKKVLVFDLDDTLVDNVHDYAEPILDGIRTIIRTLGPKAPHVTKIALMEQEIDLARRRDINPNTGHFFGYSMERFPGSLAEVYRRICKESCTHSLAEVEAELYQIGLRAFDESMYKRKIKPGVLETIDFLNDRGDICMLLTKGDKRVQSKKIAALGQASLRFWSGIKIVENKTPEIFKRMVRRFEGYSFYSVGNSYESDIVPALAVGFKGVLIYVETWETIGKREEIFRGVDHSRCLVFDDISQIQSEYDKL